MKPLAIALWLLTAFAIGELIGYYGAMHAIGS